MEQEMLFGLAISSNYMRWIGHNNCLDTADGNENAGQSEKMDT